MATLDTASKIPMSQVPDLSSTYVSKSVAEVVSLNVGLGNTNARIPFRTQVQADAAAPGTGDYVAHLLRTDVVGDFTGIKSTNSGWVWGANLYTKTGTGATDGKGLTYLTGALVEASIGGAAFTGTAFGLMVEAAFIGPFAGGEVGNMTSLKVGAPKRKDGASAGTARNVFGVWVDAVRDGALGSLPGTAYSLFVEGGRTHLGGDVMVGGSFTVGQNSAAYIGGHKLYNKSGRLGTDSGIEAANLVVSGGISAASVLADNLMSRIDSSRKIFWGAGSPEGRRSASTGSLFLRTDGGARTTLYVKENGTGSYGWAAK
ncbi:MULTISPECIES: hypothetical protein [unclassified Pseudarthrobacter]|uniref:hypothetical protein n=1 Tax=unclassified Pseudarthrobacter TaxID=2647000 RepID=UPI00362A6D75